MPRLLLLALVAATALILGAVPALAATPAAPASAPHASTPATADDDPGDDWGEDPGDDLGEDPGDDVGDDPGDDSGDDDACVEEWDDDAGEWITVDGDCADDGDLCWEDDSSDDPGDDYGDDGSDDPAAVTATADDGSADDWSEDTCDDAVAESAPLVSKLRATPSRHGRGLRVKVKFRLDRAGDVALTLERVGAQSSRRCAAPARANGHGKPKVKKNCSRTVALSGTMSVAGHAGKNATTLRRWKGHKLAAGSYRLTVTPDAAGARSAKTTFKVAAQNARRS